MVKLKLYASICTRNDSYMTQVQECADELGLSYSLEKITDEEEIRSKGFINICFVFMCPGCVRIKSQTRRPEGVPALPVLTANDNIIYQDVPLSKQELLSAVKEHV